jgi:hypothetical protein
MILLYAVDDLIARLLLHRNEFCWLSCIVVVVVVGERICAIA